MEFSRQRRTSGEISESVERQLNGWMQEQIGHWQDADRQYWRPIIAELKTFRSRGLLLPEGTAV